MFDRVSFRCSDKNPKYALSDINLQISSGAANVSLAGFGAITVGIIVSFLGMARQLSQTIGQASMQVSLIAMGLAGAGRVFELIDQVPEQDDGYVTLVRAERDSDGTLHETAKRTEL